VVRLCLNLNRTRTGREVPLDDVSDGKPSPAEALQAKHEHEALGRAVEHLPPSQRMAIVLRHLHGLSYAEIAELMGVTSKAVECLLARARVQLRTRLASDG
jgi:RNA polymerase sigma-70 factor (ECF subfamily)